MAVKVLCKLLPCHTVLLFSSLWQRGRLLFLALNEYFLLAFFLLISVQKTEQKCHSSLFVKKGLLLEPYSWNLKKLSCWLSKSGDIKLAGFSLYVCMC